MNSQTSLNGAELLYDDGDIAVVCKPSGMATHRSPGHEEPALADLLARRFPSMREAGSPDRPGVVHRLDIETSGVMVFAKTRAAYLSLRRQFESHKDVEKTYLAVLHGTPPSKTGTIDEPVGRDRLRAVSHWTVLGRRGGLSLVEFKIDTGRMHQIRIHAAKLGCPVAGDSIYGDKTRDRRMKRKPARQLLHAVEISFIHPSTAKRVTFAAPPPEDIVFAVS